MEQTAGTVCHRLRASRIKVQTEIHSKRFGPGDNMGDYIDGFESMFERLAAMESKVSEDMQVAILLASFADMKEYDGVISELKTLKPEDLTWDTVTASLLEEHRSKKPCEQKENLRQDSERLLGVNCKTKCFLCDENHFARDCKYKAEFKKFIEEQKQAKLQKRGPRLG